MDLAAGSSRDRAGTFAVDIELKAGSPAVTVTIFRAWIMPTWIFCLATMMEPR